MYASAGAIQRSLYCGGASTEHWLNGTLKFGMYGTHEMLICTKTIRLYGLVYVTPGQYSNVPNDHMRNHMMT
jgi:hypothetical protein